MLECVVGGCRHKNEQVERCYLNVNGHVRNDHASLDLCWFHQTFFMSKTSSYSIDGWDPKEKCLNE